MNLLKSVIQFDKRKGVIGCVLAMSIFVISCVGFEWQKGLTYSIAFAVLGFFRIDFNRARINVPINALWGYCVIILTWYTSYTATNTLSDISQSDDKMLLNSLCIAGVIAFIFTVTANWKVSVSAGSALLCILATTSGFLNQFRGKELCPVDFLSCSTALDVADLYTPYVSPDTFWGWVMCLLAIFIAFFIPPMPKLDKIWTRIIALISSVVIFAVMFYGARDVKIQSWGDFGSRFNGFYLNFALGVRDLSFNKPDNYSIQTIKLYEQKYLPLEEEQPIPPNQSVAEQKNKYPNIIAIMDESFADFRVFGNGLNTNIPVTPFIDSLEENTIRGYALASVFGGNTANSEFEFLTGSSLAFLPPNAIPYQQYIKGELGTLAWFLNDCGYTSTATHPCPPSNWSRGRIYPYFGFSNNTFESDYPTDSYIREFVSDRAVFEHVIHKLENKEKDKPMFVFAVTMQNHSSYNYSGDNYTQTVELAGYSREYPSTEQYLTVINETDKAVEYLLTELKNSSENTVVVFFGDHQPAVENEFYNEIYGEGFDTLQEQMIQYKVPFFIWANYDIDEQYIECTSLNYLSRYLVDACGFELTPYYSFLKNMEKTIPALNSLGYYSKEKGGFVSYEEASGREAKILNEYSILQYNNLFDSQNRSNVFFEDYISS